MKKKLLHHATTRCHKFHLMDQITPKMVLLGSVSIVLVMMAASAYIMWRQQNQINKLKGGMNA